MGAEIRPGLTVLPDHDRHMLRQLCDDLRLLRLQAGGPSLRALATRLGLGKSQLGSILSSRISQLPDWDVVRAIVDACVEFAQDHDRLSQLSVPTGIEQFWRHRYALVEYAQQQEAARRALTAAGGARPAPGVPVPRQLPAAPRRFAGRAGPLATLDALLNEDGHNAAVVIAAISGTAGVGKTALAVYWAHRVADRFPDGQLYVDLGGFGPSWPAVEPGEVVRQFLDALGVPAGRIPPDPDAQVALFRSKLAGRRMLILLDNAHDSGQVRQLLPGTPGCIVLVTSRTPLTGLVATADAHPIALDLLSRAEAEDLLTRRLGRTRVAAEPQAVADLIDSCARLPLALAVVAARGATQEVPLAELAAELRDRDAWLEVFEPGDPTSDIHAVFAWSYRALTPAAARLFRLLGRHPGPDFTAPALASLTALPPPKVRPLLAELVRANLVTWTTPGRYTCHDLLRGYAAQLSATAGAGSDEAATGRILDHYLHSASIADRLLRPNRDPLTLAAPRPGAVPERFTDRDSALRWLTAEHPVLLAMVGYAAETGYDRHAWQVAEVLTGFLERNRLWSDQVTVGTTAVAAARRLADPRATALAHRILARAYIETSRYEEADAQLDLAMDADTGSGNLAGQAHTHHHRAYLCERRGRYRAALDHTQQALALYADAGHRYGQAAALNAIGWYHAQLGDHTAALPACEQALTLLRELGHCSGQAATLDSLGYAHHCLGNHAEAVRCYRQALDLYRELGEPYQEACMLIRLADTHQVAGSPGAASSARHRALTILTELGHPDAEAVRARLAALA